MITGNSSYFKPQPSLRQVPIEDPTQCAICFIDTQNYNCSTDGAIFQSLSEADRHSADTQYYFQQVQNRCIPNWRSLQDAFRCANAEVMYTVIQSLTMDGRDRSLDYKISGFHVPPNSFDAQVLPDMKPLDTEIVLPKTSSSVFQSTVIDYVLRNMGIKQLVLCGCVTDQCVEHAVRDACDKGYLVTLVTDACATYSDARHAASIKAVAGYCRLQTTAEVVQEVRSARQREGK